MNKIDILLTIAIVGALVVITIAAIVAIVVEIIAIVTIIVGSVAIIISFGLIAINPALTIYSLIIFPIIYLILGSLLMVQNQKLYLLKN